MLDSEQLDLCHALAIDEAQPLADRCAALDRMSIVMGVYDEPKADADALAFYLKECC